MPQSRQFRLNPKAPTLRCVPSGETPGLGFSAIIFTIRWFLSRSDNPRPILGENPQAISPPDLVDFDNPTEVGLINVSLMSRLQLLYLVALVLTAASCFGDSEGIPVEWIAYAGKGKFVARIVPATYDANGSNLLKPSRIQVLQISSDENRYDQIGIFPTFNGHAPLKLLVSDAGDRIVALDEQGGMGRGERAVVVYDISGHVLSSWTVMEILTATERKRVPETVSSTWWRQDADLIGRRLSITGPARVFQTNDAYRGYGHVLDLDSQKWLQ